ncbi:19753_t:CDS:2, partial [Funneliformis geosporum]
IYLYYQQRKNNLANFTGSDNPGERSPWAFSKDQEIAEVKKVNKIFADFCKNEIGGQDINEIRAKLNGRTLAELLEENEDYETSIDELKRTKGELEAEQKDLGAKYKKKAKQLDEEQCENNKLTEKIENPIANATVKYENQVQQTVNPHINKAKETVLKPKKYYGEQDPFYRGLFWIA